MIQELSLDEIAWRYETLNYNIEPSLQEIIDNGGILPEDQDVSCLTSFVSASLVYLQKAGAISIVLHKDESVEGAFFTATRLQCRETSWSLDECDSYERPSDKIIPVPVLLDEPGNEECSYISLIFNFPDTNIGRLCKRFVDYLRQSCKRDVDVINVVVFLDRYCTTDSAYARCLMHTIDFIFWYDRWLALYQCPSEVDELIGMILEDSVEDLYDPFMRTGTNIMFTYDKYHGQATDKNYLYATMLTAGVWGIDTENIELSDCTLSWEPRDCDAIIASPEFDMEIVNADGKQEPAGTWALEKVYMTLKEDLLGRDVFKIGKGIVKGKTRKGLLVLPSSILTSFGKAERLRHDITESALLDTVVLLPANLFPMTGIAVAIILLDSGRENSKPITFADFSSLGFVNENGKHLLDIDEVKKAVDENKSKYICNISISEIRENNYEWYTPKYIHKQSEIPSGYGKFAISSLLQEYESEDFDYGPSNRLLSLSDMVSNPFEEYPELEKASGIDDKDRFMEVGYVFFKHSCFAIDFGDEIKTYYHKDDQTDFLRPVLAVPDAIPCYFVNPDLIHIGYLRMLLRDNYSEVKKQNPTASVADLIKLFMQTEVVIPLALEEQARLYEQAQLNYALEKARKDGLDEAINSMKQEYMMEVRMRKHDMKPFLSQLDSQAKLISFYMDKIEGDEETVSAIRQKLQGISNAVSELRIHLNRLTEEDIYGAPELINPLDILNDLTGTFNNYSVELQVDSIALREAGIDVPEIYISRVDFSTLCTTIIENAVSHAFCDGGDDYRVLISLTYDSEKSSYVIDFINNGSKMPVGMDKFRYGLKGEKGAKSSGSGLGGYRVKSITRHFGGDYDVFCNGVHNLTTIRVYFPKYNAYE